MAKPTVTELGQQGDHWARTSQSYIQSIFPRLPCYAPQGWWREADTLLDLARKLIASSISEYLAWKEAQDEASASPP